jgi:phage gpG-like protein
LKTVITAIAAILLVASTASFAYAEVPAWVKNNAGWWAEGTISETEFLSGIECFF